MKLYKEKKKKYYRKKQQYSESSEVFDTSADEDSLNAEQDHDDSNHEGNKKKLLLELMYDKNYRPMKFRELCVLLDVSKARRYELETALNQLVDEGKIGISAHGKYGKPELFTLKGSFSSTSRGFGFVTVEEKDNDIFIAPDNTLGPSWRCCLSICNFPCQWKQTRRGTYCTHFRAHAYKCCRYFSEKQKFWLCPS